MKKILIFLHGTIIMHQSGANCSRDERVKQSERRDTSVLDYENYIPIGDAVKKVREWQKQGYQIAYLSSHEDAKDVEKDRTVLERYDFPKAEIYYRKNGESYAQVAEKIMPDILIEDDCESIGGAEEMTITHIKREIKKNIKSIFVKEFEGVDNLPDRF